MLAVKMVLPGNYRQPTTLGENVHSYPEPGVRKIRKIIKVSLGKVSRPETKSKIFRNLYLHAFGRKYEEHMINKKN